MIYLSHALMADTARAAVLVVLALVVFVNAVLFAERSEPFWRLLEIIKAVRNRSSAASAFF